MPVTLLGGGSRWGDRVLNLLPLPAPHWPPRGGRVEAKLDTGAAQSQLGDPSPTGHPVGGLGHSDHQLG